MLLEELLISKSMYFTLFQENKLVHFSRIDYFMALNFHFQLLDFQLYHFWHELYQNRTLKVILQMKLLMFIYFNIALLLH